MNNELPLEPFNNVKADLLFWVKQFLSSKIHALKVDDGFAISFNKEAIRDRIINAIDDKNLDDVTKEIRRTGMKNLGVYSTSLLAFYRYAIGSKKLKSIKDIDTDFRDDYFELNAGKHSEGTLEIYFTQVNSLFKFIDAANAEQYKFRLGRSRGEKKASKPNMKTERALTYLLPDELKRFLNKVDNFFYKIDNPAQTRLMMKLACFGALSTEELVSLKVKHLSLVKDPNDQLLEKGKYLKIDVMGKGGKVRYVYVKASLIQKDYDECLKHRSCSDGLLFCNWNNEPYNNRTPYDKALKIFKQADVQKSGMNTLRRSYAALLILKNVDLTTISVLLGFDRAELADLAMQITKDGHREIVKTWDEL